MKKFFKILGIVIGVLFLVLVGVYGYVMTQFPKVEPAPELVIEPTPEMIERGRYLAVTSFSCIDCHSQRDPEKFQMPLVEGTEGQGGMDYGEGAGFVPAKNITPDVETGIGGWTDGEIFRAITTGIDKDGEPIAPMMPFMLFREVDSTDIIAVIAYIKTLKPIHNNIPDKELNFPLNLIFRTMQGPAAFKPKPDPSDRLATGQYLAMPCIFCHTPSDQGVMYPDSLLAGGVPFMMPGGGFSVTANITPDKETGIGVWTKDMFIKRFKDATNPATHTSTPIGTFNTIMPWTFYGQMTEEDLGAIYDYIMTVKPVKHQVVEKYIPPSGPQSNRK
jgi:mono/diheme cytochrome c family protein